MNWGFFRTGLVFSHYFRNYYRSRSFYLMLFIVVLVVSLLTYLSFKYFAYNADLPNFLRTGIVISGSLKRSEFLFIWEFAGNYLPVFAGVFFGSPAISSEIESRTAFHTFTLPVPRFVLYSGKFLAAFSVSAIIMSFFYAGQLINYVLLYSRLPGVEFLQSYGAMLFFALAIIAITFLVSTVFNKNTYAYISVFILYFLILSTASLVITFLYGVTPYYLLNVASSIDYEVYINFNPFDFSSLPSLSPAPLSQISTYVMVMVIYAVSTFLAGAYVFENKEVN